MERSNFDFMQELNSELASIARLAEDSIWNNPRATLTQGRLFGEHLSKIVSVQEKVEPVYAIKQTERLHRLLREGLIDNRVLDKFEWLRRNGNTAAHVSEEVHVDLALTAHRHMFELASWYAELYGAVDQHISAYQMPFKSTPSSQEVHVKSELDPGLIEQMIADKLEAKLLPTLDEKFRYIQESIEKLAESKEMGMNQRPEESDLAQLQAAETMAHDKTDVNGKVKQLTSDKIEIGECLKKYDLEVIDKRPYGGALWIVGGWGLKEKLWKWKPHGLHFRFARNGSQSTSRRPAWFLLGKNPSAERWVSLDDEVKPTHTIQPNFTEAATKTFATTLVDEENTLPQPVHEVMNKYPIINSPDVISDQYQHTCNIEEDAVDDTKHDTESVQDTVWIPEHLKQRYIRDFASQRLIDLSDELGAVTFGDWNEYRLLQLYANQPKLLHDIMVQLWFFGFRFTGKLGRFLKLEHENDEPTIGMLQENIPLSEMLEPSVCRLLQRFGITRSEQLSGVPISSLSWLLRGQHNETVNRLRSIEKQEDEISSVHSSDPAKLMFRMGSAEINLPDQFREFRIDELPFQGCNALLQGIQEYWNISYLGELPEDLTVLPSRIKGVGSTALSKFVTQLKELGTTIQFPFHAAGLSVSKHIPQSSNLRVSETGTISWKEKLLEVTDMEYHIRLDEQSFTSIRKLLLVLQEKEINTIGQLPYRLEQLLAYDGVGQSAVQKFYDQLHELLFQYKQNAAEEAQWNKLNDNERMMQSIESIQHAWKAWLNGADSTRGNQRSLKILKFRWKAKQEGRKVTLEGMGQWLGLTKERVRQIIASQLSKLHRDTQKIEKAIKDTCMKQDGFYYYPMKTSESLEHYLIVEVLETVHLYYLEAYGWWTSRLPNEIEELQEKLKKELNKAFKGTRIAQDMLDERITYFNQKAHVPIPLLQQFAKEHVRNADDSTFILINSKKQDIVEMVLRQYPEGVEVYKRASELLLKANDILPQGFEKEREFTSVLSRDEFADIGYLWGRGTYIHHSYVYPDKELIREVSNTAELLLNKRSPISVGKLYAQYELKLCRAGVPNEYALYTLLRKYGTATLQLRKFPHIWHESDGFQVNNAEMIKSYIRELNHPVTNEELKQEFVTNRGWKYFTVDYNLATDPDFVRVDYGVISLREFYIVEENVIAQLYDKLKELTLRLPVIHMNLLFEEMKNLCSSYGIDTPYLLYDLLRAKEDSEFLFVRYPLVALANQEWEDISLQTITEQYILEQGAEVPREQVWNWLIEEVGARESTLDLVLSSSQDIFYYTRGKYGEYIHRDNLEWTVHKESQLLTWVDSCLASALEEGRPYISAIELLVPNRLPELKNNLEWSEDLLIDILKKSKSVRLIGSYDAIIAPLGSSFIQNESDFVTHILEKYFGGDALFRDLHSKLAELKYSKDGQLLIETESAIEQEKTSIRVVDGRFILDKQCMQLNNSMRR